MKIVRRILIALLFVLVGLGKAYPSAKPPAVLAASPITPLITHASQPLEVCLPNALVLFHAQAQGALQDGEEILKSAGGCAVHLFPPQALIGYLPVEAQSDFSARSEVLAVYTQSVPQAGLDALPEAAQIAAAVWNNQLERARQPQVEAQTEGQPLVGDVLPRPDAGPKAQETTSTDFTEFMGGRIAVGIILPESNGSIDPNRETWSTARMDTVINQIQMAMNWWAASYPRVNLSFVYDIHRQVPTSYEPIRHPYSYDARWIGQTLTTLGYGGANFDAQVTSYLNQMRSANHADWTVLIAVADSANDRDGTFTDGYFAYTYGQDFPLIVMTYDNDGWGITSMHDVLAHEFAHTFGAGDEYCQPGYSCCQCDDIYGYLGQVNSNCSAGCDLTGNGVCDGNDNNSLSNCGACSVCRNVSCLMKDGGTDAGVCEVTLAQVGLRDTDGDDIPDPLDTTLSLNLTQQPGPVINQVTADFAGTAQDLPYPSPTRTSRTINYLTEVVYELDGSGSWLPASADDGAIDQTSEAFHFTTPTLVGGLHSVVIRVTNRSGIQTLQTITFHVDDQPPVCTPRRLDPFLLRMFNVDWSAQDLISPVTGYDVQVRDGAGGSWQDWQTGVTLTQVSYNGEIGHTYFFRCRAVDSLGNQGSWPVDPQAFVSTQVVKNAFARFLPFFR